MNLNISEGTIRSILAAIAGIIVLIGVYLWLGWSGIIVAIVGMVLGNASVPRRLQEKAEDLKNRVG